jgi:hypothetical protein
MPDSPITWTQDKAAGVPLRKFVGHVGEVEVGAVAYDGSNRLWTWSSPLSIEAWGHAPTESGAKQAFEVWLRDWLKAFRPFFETPPNPP